METILLIAHTEPDGSLPRSACEALSAAKAVVGQLPGSSLIAALIGEQVHAGADAIANCGAQRILAVLGPDFAHARYATDAAAAEALCRSSRATLVFAPATSRMNRMLPGVAQRLGGRVDTHVTGVATLNAAPAVNRWYYRQRMEAQLQRTQRPWIMLVDPGSTPAWTGMPGTSGAPGTGSNARIWRQISPALRAQSITVSALVILSA